MLLLAAVQSTALHSALLAALPSGIAARWLARCLAVTLQALLLTLLFLCAVGLRRTWDLRFYSGDALGLLTARPRAYGYRIAERFLATLAHSGAAERMTQALARWTARLWLPEPDPARPTIVYIDGHRKPIYSDVAIPRGLIGRSGKILGCRALTLLHDQTGHVLLATTQRGDQHLTTGIPDILSIYEAANPGLRLGGIVVDREGMSAAWIARLVEQGRTVITLLRRDQYKGLESFSELGAFVPLVTAADGSVLREVAPARFHLPHPEHPEQPIMLSVALIRDHRWREVVPSAAGESVNGTAQADWAQQHWWEADWQAPPAAAGPTQAHLIPIVSSAVTTDAVALATLYTRRWPCQENVIRDWLLPLGLDTNHGYAKTAVLNSEIEKLRSKLSERDERLGRWATRAREQHAEFEQQGKRRYAKRKERGAELYSGLSRQQHELEQQGVAWGERKHIIKERQVEIDIELGRLNERLRAAERKRDDTWRKLEKYCREQSHVRRELADLAARERQMYAVENNKDQIMTVCKVALANLGMYVRDRWFPSSYATATWARLAPFFALRGRVRGEREWVQVELRPFNDRQLNRDLAELCSKVAEREARLPDGRRLIFSVGSNVRPDLDAH